MKSFFFFCSQVFCFFLLRIRGFFLRLGYSSSACLVPATIPGTWDGAVDGTETPHGELLCPTRGNRRLRLTTVAFFRLTLFFLWKFDILILGFWMLILNRPLFSLIFLSLAFCQGLGNLFYLFFKAGGRHTSLQRAR